MAQDDNPRYRLERTRERVSENLPGDEAQPIVAFSRAIDPDEQGISGPKKSVRTVGTYTQCVFKTQRDYADVPLLELDQEGLQGVVSDLSDDYAASTVGQYQSALKLFYGVHDAASVDPEAINVSSGGTSSIDERTVLERDEFFAIRDAAENPRDRCLVDLLGYTGQRIRAIQTLRVGDVYPHEGRTGVYYLNEGAEGLKSAEKTMKKRPLLGAKRAVLDMLEYHPTGNEDDPLLTVLQSASRGTPGDEWSQATMRYTLKKLAERAGVDKPVNPHAFRHFFVTAAKRDYEMDDGQIKKLLGHAPDSNIMATTYAHLSDDDTIGDVEDAFGVEDDETDESESESRLTPPTCPECYAPVPDGAKACHCGYAFTPDATDRLAELEQRIEEFEELLG